MAVVGRTIDLEITARPPVKQMPADAAERARQPQANMAFREAFVAAYPSWWMFTLAVDLDLSIDYERGAGRSDSANIIGGIADQLESCNAYHNDRQLRRVTYAERPSADGLDRFRVHVEVMPS